MILRLETVTKRSVKKKFEDVSYSEQAAPFGFAQGRQWACSLLNL